MGILIYECENFGNINADGNYVGGIIGWANSGGTNNQVTGALRGCCNHGTITTKDTADYVGGLAGYGKYMKIDSPSNVSDVRGRDYIGGIAGYCNYILVDGYTNSVSVTGRNYVGGIVGASDSKCQVKNCIGTGTVDATGNYVGGLIGSCKTNCDIINCKTETVTTVTGAGYVGGIVGYVDCGVNGFMEEITNNAIVNGTGDRVGGIAGYSNIESSYLLNNGQVSGGDQVGGLAGYKQNTIRSSKNLGYISGTGSTGGLVGKSCGIIINSLNNANVVSTTGACGGIIGTEYTLETDPSEIYNCYSVGNVNGAAGKTSTIAGVYVDSYTMYSVFTTASSRINGVAVPASNNPPSTSFIGDLTVPGNPDTSYCFAANTFRINMTWETEWNSTVWSSLNTGRLPQLIKCGSSL